MRSSSHLVPTAERRPDRGGDTPPGRVLRLDLAWHRPDRVGVPGGRGGDRRRGGDAGHRRRAPDAVADGRGVAHWTGTRRRRRCSCGRSVRRARWLRVAPSSLRSNAFAYVAVEAWLGGPLEPVDPDEALAWLAGDYLHAFGPARVADFRWWAGTTADAGPGGRRSARDRRSRGRTAAPGRGPRRLRHDRPVDADSAGRPAPLGHVHDGLRARRPRPVRSTRRPGARLRRQRQRLWAGPDRRRRRGGLGPALRGPADGGRSRPVRAVGRLDRRATIVGRFEQVGALLDAADVVIADGPPRGPGGPGSRRPV